MPPKTADDDKKSAGSPKTGLNPSAAAFEKPKQSSSAEKSAVGLRPEAAPFIKTEKDTGLSVNAPEWVPPTRGKGKKGKGKGGGGMNPMQQAMQSQQQQQMMQMQMLQMQMMQMQMMQMSAQQRLHAQAQLSAQMQNSAQTQKGTTWVPDQTAVSGVPLTSPATGGYQGDGAKLQGAGSKPKMTKSAKEFSAATGKKAEQTSRLHTASAPDRDFSEGPGNGADLFRQAAKVVKRKK